MKYDIYMQSVPLDLCSQQPKNCILHIKHQSEKVSVSFTILQMFSYWLNIMSTEPPIMVFTLGFVRLDHGCGRVNSEPAV